MKILSFTKNDSVSQQMNPQTSLLYKIKNLIRHLFSFIQNNTFCIYQSKEGNQSVNLSKEILRTLEEEKSCRENKKDLTFITFLFNETTYDTPKNNKAIEEEPIYEEMKSPLYDIPTNNKIVYQELFYDIPLSKRVIEEPAYKKMDEPLYDVPKSNKSLRKEPIYEEIDESSHSGYDSKIIDNTPPPLPPRNR